MDTTSVHLQTTPGEAPAEVAARVAAVLGGTLVNVEDGPDYYYAEVFTPGVPLTEFHEVDATAGRWDVAVSGPTAPAADARRSEVAALLAESFGEVREGSPAT
jgi:hypothetical protein